MPATLDDLYLIELKLDDGQTVYAAPERATNCIRHAQVWTTEEDSEGFTDARCDELDENPPPTIAGTIADKQIKTVAMALQEASYRKERDA